MGKEAEITGENDMFLNCLRSYKIYTIDAFPWWKKRGSFKEERPVMERERESV